MTEAVPNYYHKFQCIADRCQHNCCIGWEIDVDEDTMEFYNTLDTKLGEKIRNNIEGDVPHFILQAGDRCPFLKENGLCEIICECGETALCEICTLHPRFRNFYSSFTETGLGLCCEEAARIILSETETFLIALPQACSLTEEETVFFAERNKIFETLQDSGKSIGARFSSLAEAFGFSFSFSLDRLCELYLSLERLDEAWTEKLESIEGFSFGGEIFEEKAMQKLFEQLAVYFVFRHLIRAIWDGDFASVVKFTLGSCYLLGALLAYQKEKNGTISLADMVETVRMYSAEVEYSEENLEALMNAVF